MNVNERECSSFLSSTCLVKKMEKWNDIKCDLNKLIVII